MMNDLFADADPQRIEVPDADLLYFRQPDLGADAALLFSRLRQDLAWREGFVQLFGKRYRQPRLLAWYGDPEAVYGYSGTRYQPLPWISVLASLRERIAAIAQTPFNSVLANLYRDNEDSMGLHADDEPELGAQPVIASLSLGEERLFRLKHRHRRDLPAARIHLEHGSLLLMGGQTQANWKHELPKQRAACGARINLTFRYVNPR
ncbi:MAG: alkylated DNA repair dioxygenase AlkB [Halieaceae bacterium]|jgi:alkylated DNA repair dioxygenase AlkB